MNIKKADKNKKNTVAKKMTTPSLASTELEIVIVLERGQAKTEHIRKVLSMNQSQLKKAILDFNQQKLKSGSPLRIIEFNENLELTIDRNYDSPALEHYKKRKKKLSKQVLETVTIIAYKQPITKAEIEKIRGSNSAGSLKVLLNEKLIQPAGTKHAPGNPLLFSTTNQFLRYFSLQSLDELPPLEEIKNYPFLQEENVAKKQSSSKKEESTEKEEKKLAKRWK